MIVEERSPGLRGRLSASDHVLADTGLTDMDAKLQQFAMNVGSSPKRIFAAQHANQLANLFGDRGAAELAAANLPAPEQTKALAMPANDSGGLHDERTGLPTLPDAAEPRPQDTISRGQFWALHGALQDTDLMTERKNLELKRGTAPK